jgi:hypothetical protein
MDSRQDGPRSSARPAEKANRRFEVDGHAGFGWASTLAALRFATSGPFSGTPTGTTVRFMFNLPMTTPLRLEEPLGGKMDLLGPPW